MCAEATLRGFLFGVDNLIDDDVRFRVEPHAFWRENLFSSATGSFARQRTIVCALGLALLGTPSATFAEVTGALRARGDRMLLAEGSTPLAFRLLAACGPTIVTRSEYAAPSTPLAAIGDGVVNVDLQRIDFPDASFSLVVTNGVMEHVPDALVAEAEIVRVLKPGGTLCFTIPFLASLEDDAVLAELLPDGRIVYHAEPRYHHDPLRPEGALVYRFFAHRAMHERFTRLGCAFESYRMWSDTLGLIGPMQWIHIARKAPS